MLEKSRESSQPLKKVIDCGGLAAAGHRQREGCWSNPFIGLDSIDTLARGQSMANDGTTPLTHYPASTQQAGMLRVPGSPFNSSADLQQNNCSQTTAQRKLLLYFCIQVINCFYTIQLTCILEQRSVSYFTR